MRRACDFLLVRNSNLGHILHRFGDIAGFLRSRVTPPPIPPQFLGCSRCTRWPMLWSARAEALSYSTVKIFSKNSNLCDHGTSTLRTDGQTDNILLHNRALRIIAKLLCVVFL